MLYEGYVLYPYRPTSKKNVRERFYVWPRLSRGLQRSANGAELCVMQSECLLQSNADSATLNVSVRFPHPMWREIGAITSPVGGTRLVDMLSGEQLPRIC